jgi:hypothetical protein
MELLGKNAFPIRGGKPCQEYQTQCNKTLPRNKVNRRIARQFSGSVRTNPRSRKGGGSTAAFFAPGPSRYPLALQNTFRSLVDLLLQVLKVLGEHLLHLIVAPLPVARHELVDALLGQAQRVRHPLLQTLCIVDPRPLLHHAPQRPGPVLEDQQISLGILCHLLFSAFHNREMVLPFLSVLLVFNKVSPTGGKAAPRALGISPREGNKLLPASKCFWIPGDHRLTGWQQSLPRTGNRISMTVLVSSLYF